jgi:hypothetical protein
MAYLLTDVSMYIQYLYSPIVYSRESPYPCGGGGYAVTKKKRRQKERGKEKKKERKKEKKGSSPCIIAKTMCFPRSLLHC